MTLEENVKKAERLAYLVKEKGGVCYYVGGFVRDRIMQNPCKDIDIEVHGIYPGELEKILDGLGERISIGESFGIYSLKGCDIDIAMPRKEKVTGKGHRDFSVTVDPFIGTEKAASRRDFTINALMQNVLTGEITDHFGGIADIKTKTLRYVNANSFTEDALRVFRAAQFCARFNFKTDEKTIDLCRRIDVSSLSKERIEGEMKKALLKSEKPSVFFETLRNFNKLLPWFSELYNLIGIKQREEFHLEGDVWSHTMMVLDEAAKRREKAEHPYEFMLSALCHDFGKAVSTKSENGITRSIGHEKAGIPVVKRFLSRITNDKKVTGYVLNITELHMLPNILAFQKSSIKATNKLFDKSVSPFDLILLASSDNSGRITAQKKESYEDFLFERLSVYEEYMSRPFITGKDLIDSGLMPDENFSDILKYAHKLRLSGAEKSTALKQCLAYKKEKFNPE